MNAKELWRYVCEKASPTLHREALKSAYHSHERTMDSRHTHTHQCISCIIQDAGEIEKLSQLLVSESLPLQSKEEKQLLSIPNLKIQEEHLCAWTRPYIAKLREMLFGQTIAPFSSYLDAVRWLEETARNQRKPSELDWRVADIVRQEIEEKIKIWERLIRSRVSRPRPEIDTRKRIIVYRKPPADSHEGKASPDTKWVPAFIDVFIDPDYVFKDGLMPLLGPSCPLGDTAPLQLLEMVAHELSHRTGFSKPAMIAHILADLPLILPAWKFHVASWNGPLRHWAEITLYSPDISVRNLQDILSGIRKQWQVRRTKRVTDDDHRLLEAVERGGGGPQTGGKGTVAFWNGIKDELELNVGWQAVQHKYKRLVKKTVPSTPYELSEYLDHPDSIEFRVKMPKH